MAQVQERGRGVRPGASTPPGCRARGRLPGVLLLSESLQVHDALLPPCNTPSTGRFCRSRSPLQDPLRGLTTLEFLDVSDTQVTNAGVKRLQEALPKLQITGRRRQVTPGDPRDGAAEPAAAAARPRD